MSLHLALAVTVSIGQFFLNLFNQGLAPALYGISAFFFAWGSIGLMFPGQRGQELAKENIYRILGALALALLTAIITSIFFTAAGGTPQIAAPTQ
ncbi:hypothetical protein KSF_086820 [Reticulibacter mediterranei]|uniref:Uncharacterized protein n=1 Tax=Reticulibacter mediterranei TaxID=2778369 RepID=A0A8J3N521_9CHLR|nr:hypothetical protein [Reticulibacter mediterranei]GHO98634.1 hypothetical protein KSF_086820 [Reticulibacter mediterranei]